MSPIRLIAVVSHPIQYQAPLFRKLAEDTGLDLTVLFLSDHGIAPTFDPGFGRRIGFDVPLLGGYHHEFVKNWSPRPGLERPWGLCNPGISMAISRHGAQVVFVHGWQFCGNQQALSTALCRGLPYVIRGEARIDTEHEMVPTKRWLKHTILGPMIRRAGACLAIGERNRDFYLAYGASPERVVDAPYGIDNERFVSAATSARAGRSRILESVGLDPGLPVVVFAAKLQPWKRPLDLLSAVGQMDQPVNLVIIGDGDLRDEVGAAVARLPRAVALGFMNQTEIPRWYGVGDVFVLPSSSEPWGLAVNEAMAAGAVPVVSDAVGCGPDLVTSATGRVFPVGDVARLAAILDDLVAHPAELAELRAAGRLVIDRFSIEAAANGVSSGARLAFDLRSRVSSR